MYLASVNLCCNMIVPYATGVDYHFYKEELYVTLSSGMILNYNLSVSETDGGTPSIEADPPQTTVYSTSGVLGSITVDWLSDTIYWIEYEGSMTKVCRWTCTCTHMYMYIVSTYAYVSSFTTYVPAYVHHCVWISFTYLAT